MVSGEELGSAPTINGRGGVERFSGSFTVNTSTMLGNVGRYKVQSKGLLCRRYREFNCTNDVKQARPSHPCFIAIAPAIQQSRLEENRRLRWAQTTPCCLSLI